MKVTLSQAVLGTAVGATATLRLDLGAPAVAPLASADVLGIQGGQWTALTLGSGLALTGKVLSATGGGMGGAAESYTLPAATDKALGGVIAGANLTIAGDGTLSLTSGNVTTALGLTPVDAAGAATAAPVQSVAGRTGAVALKAADVSGLATVATTGAYGDLTGAPAAYSLPPATSKALGGVIVGTNITVASGTISLSGANVTAALGLTPVDAAGAAAASPVQSVAGRAGVVTLAAADVSGLATVATTGAYGDLTGAPAAYSLPAATSKALGGVIVGTNITVASGTISLSGANVTAALGLTPVDAAGASAAAPVQSVAGATGTVALPYGMTVDFSQGAAPIVGTLTLDGGAAGPVTISQVDHFVGAAGGTIEATLQIVSSGVATDITGLDALVTSGASVLTGTASAANKMGAGDRLQMVITKVTGTPDGAFFRIRGTQP